MCVCAFPSPFFMCHHKLPCLGLRLALPFVRLALPLVRSVQDVPQALELLGTLQFLGSFGKKIER